MSEINEPNTLANAMAPLIVPQGSIDHAMKYGQDAMKALTECQSRYANFVTMRLAEDVAMPSRLAECHTPMEVIDVWAGFYRTAMQQYAEHLHQMSEMGQKMVTDAVEETTAEAEEALKIAGEAAESTVAAVKSKAA